MEVTHLWMEYSCVKGIQISIYVVLMCGQTFTYGRYMEGELTSGGDIHVWELLTCGGVIHIYMECTHICRVNSCLEGTFPVEVLT